MALVAPRQILVPVCYRDLILRFMGRGMSETTVNVRYIVHDAEASIAWYTKHLGFKLISPHSPT